MLTRIVQQSHLLFLSLILWSFASTAIACEFWQDDLEQILVLEKNGKGFAAIEQLNELIIECPNLARLPLELGDLWYRMGNYDQAINIWQQTVQNYPLPDRVAAKVQLRILQARFNPIKRLSYQSEIRIGYEGELRTEQQSWNSNVFAGIKYRLPAKGFMGYTVQRGPYANITGYQSSSTESEQGTNMLAAETGWNWNSKPVKLRFGIRAQEVIQKTAISQSNESAPTLLLVPKLVLGNWSYSHRIDWAFQQNELTYSPNLTGRFTDFRVRINAKIQQTSLQSSTTQVGMGIRWGKRLRPELSVRYYPVDKDVELKTALAWMVRKNWQIHSYGKFKITTQDTSLSTAKLGAGISWRH